MYLCMSMCTIVHMHITFHHILKWGTTLCTVAPLSQHCTQQCLSQEGHVWILQLADHVEIRHHLGERHGERRQEQGRIIDMIVVDE